MLIMINRLVQVLENETLEGGIQTFESLPMPLSAELSSKYASDFKYVVATTSDWEQIVSYQNHKFTWLGRFAQAQFPEMITLKMLKGSHTDLRDPSSVLLSQSLANTLFSNSEPIGKFIKISDQYTLQVKGVYEDLPHNSTFHAVDFIAPIELLFPDKQAMNNWHSSSFQILTQLHPKSSFSGVSLKIKDVLYQNNKDASKPTLFLNPMSKWHLYSEFKNGANTGGRIDYVYLFSLIGGFVLLLACINFMNLATARSATRAKEVGIRKAIGSRRSQLINQFLSESLLVVAFAFVLALLLVQLSLPWFNEVADKNITVLWPSSSFWLAGIGFILFTGLLAGSYPAIYLSSFNPVKVLKGTFHARTHRGAFPHRGAFLRKVLVVVQFSISVTLIISTLLVYEQIAYAKNRPIGYSREGLINIGMNTPELQSRYDALRNDLLATGAITDLAQSSSPVTGIWSSANNLDWQGKDPNRQALFGTISVTPGFGKVVGWELQAGREFSSAYATDSLAFIFNEAAVKLIGIENIVGQTIRWHDKNWTVIGVVKNMVMESPYTPTRPTVFMMNNQERPFNWIHIKLNPQTSIREALSKIETVMKKHNPASPFEYKFADEEYAKKFAAEERIGQLAAFFASLAILISCLGLFGLASFMAEQRRKELGVRKVLGATVANLWALLSKDFVYLILISFLISTPLAYYFLSGWLERYEYRTGLSPWIFAVSGAGAILLTILTVSYQAIKAALANPVKSLRSE